MQIPMLGEDQSGFVSEYQDLSKEHALKEGMHNALSDIVKYTVLGGVALIVAGIVLKETHAKKILNRLTGG